MKTLINNPVFRWVAVVPGAFLATIGAMFPWHWTILFYANYVGEETLGLGTLTRIVGIENIERLGYGFISPFVLIVIGAKIAPKNKVATGRVIALIVGAGLVYVGLMMPQYEVVGYFQAASGWGKLYPVVLVTLWVTGIYTALRFNNGAYTDPDKPSSTMGA